MQGYGAISAAALLLDCPDCILDIAFHAAYANFEKSYDLQLQDAKECIEKTDTFSYSRDDNCLLGQAQELLQAMEIFRTHLAGCL